VSIFDSRPVRDVIGVVFFLLFLALLVLGVARCKPAQDSTLPAYCVEESLYTAALLRCVDKASTLAESQMCREQVDYSCGIRQTKRAK
jgi:hypothetical protein